MNIAALLPVALPIFSGLTFLAYKHPEGYSRLFKSMSKWVYPAFLITLAFSAGKSDALKPFVSGSIPDVAAKAAILQKESDDWFAIIFFYVGGAWLYLAMLTYLPQITQPAAKTTIDVKEPNQALEPTTMAVTPPAAQEPRQP